MLEDGTFDVDANTSIDDLSEELSVKIPEVYFFIWPLLSHKLLGLVHTPVNEGLILYSLISKNANSVTICTDIGSVFRSYNVERIERNR